MMERQLTVVKPLGAVSNSEMRRQFSAPAMFRAGGSDVSLEVMRRPSARAWVTVRTNGRGQRLQQEARELFERERSRLVEKPGTTTTTTSTTTSTRSGIPLPDTATWTERGGGGGVGTQHTHYLRRLVDLRDELMTQEETALARAVDRLRLHSINNRDMARYRLKLKEPGGDIPRVGGGGLPSPQGPATIPRPMLTTVEKFRQTRPQQRQPPVLFPLQGKQLIECSSVSNGSSGSGSNSITEDGSQTKSTASAPQQQLLRGSGGAAGGVEDTVRLNLQRLAPLYPSSSIPNIGRKALPRRHPLQEAALELRSQPLQYVRHHRVFRPARPGLVSPFRLQQPPHYPHSGVVQDGRHGATGEEGGDGAQGSHRRGLESQEEASSPPSLSQTPGMGTMIDGDRLDMEKLNQYYYIYCLPDDSLDEDPQCLPTTQDGRVQQEGSNPRRTHSERLHDSEKSGVRRSYSDRAGLQGVGSSSSFGHKRTLSMVTDPGRISLPVIHSGGENSHPARRHGTGKVEAFVTETDAVSSSHDLTSPSSERRRRRHIVINMPHILFSSAPTPDVTREPTLTETDCPLEPALMTRTVRQSEVLTHKELDTWPLPESST